MNFKHFFDERKVNDHPKKIEVEKKISNKGKFIFQNGQMLFQRVGPMAGQYQSNTRAPEVKGIWAFPFPIFDWFYALASFSHVAKHSPKIALDDKDKNIIDLSLYDELFIKRELKKLSQSKHSNHEYLVDDIIDALKSKKIHKSTLHELKNRKNTQGVRKIKKFFWGNEVYSHFAPKGKAHKGEWYRYETAKDFYEEVKKHVFAYVNNWSTGDKLAKMGVRGMGKTNDNWTWDAGDFEVFIPVK